MVAAFLSMDMNDLFQKKSDKSEKSSVTQNDVHTNVITQGKGTEGERNSVLSDLYSGGHDTPTPRSQTPSVRANTAELRQAGGK